MLIEEIDNIEIEYDLFNSIIEALEKNIKMKESIKQYCCRIKNNRINFFDKHLEILVKLNIIELMNYEYNLKFHWNNYINNRNRFIDYFLETLKQDGSLNEIFNSESIKKIENDFYISNYEIPLKYSGLRNFFVTNNIFEIIKKNNNIFRINKKYIKFFVFEKKMSLNQLKNILKKEEEQGKIAEEFVLHYEKKRTKCENKIKQISNEDASAGYDIISVYSQENKEKIFIEVKSYKNKKIYITRNEIETAKEYGDKYYLYIVDMLKIKNKDYKPQIIKNPYKNIIMNEKFEKVEELISVKIEDEKNKNT